MTEVQSSDDSPVIVMHYTEVQQVVDHYLAASENARRSLGGLRSDLRKTTAAARTLSQVCEKRLQSGALQQITSEQRQAVEGELTRLGLELSAMRNYFNNTADRDLRRLKGYFDAFAKIETYHPH